jgi:ketosteroid isomerase-like protein
MRHILIVGTLLGMAAAVLVTSGCAKTGTGVSDEDQIRVLLGQWKEGILAADADMIMATYSENFAPHDTYGYKGDDKAGLRKYVEKSIKKGRYEGVEIGMEDVDIAIEEGVATAYPIKYTNAEGTVTMKLTLTKEEAGWLITDMLIEAM